MEWYYSTVSGRVGPVSLERMQELLVSKEIDYQTLVWKAGMADWIPVYKCNEVASAKLVSEPPPISENNIGDGLIWALCLAPIWGGFAQILSTDLRVLITNENFVFYRQMWWVGLVINIIFIFLDVSRLKRAGHNTEKLTWWMYLLVPIYIFQRDKLLNAGMTRFWIWIGAFLISLVYFKF